MARILEKPVHVARIPADNKSAPFTKGFGVSEGAEPKKVRQLPNSMIRAAEDALLELKKNHLVNQKGLVPLDELIKAVKRQQ